MSASPLRGKHAAGTILIEALEHRHREFLAQLTRVRRRTSEPGLHDLRVSTRRLIAVIDLALRLHNDARLQKRKKALRSFLRGFNALRDANIQRLVVRKIGGGGPAARIYLRVVQTSERQLMQDARRQLRQIDVPGLQRDICATQDVLLTISIHPVLAPAVRAMLLGALADSFVRVVRRRQDVSGTEPATVHRLRVAFKQYRYCLEILSPVLPWMDAVRRKKLNGYQTAMGEIQDLSVLLEGITAYEMRHPITGRMAMIGLREQLLRRRAGLMETFLARADDLYTFWKARHVVHPRQ
jgi:CHAD domain-containing protein